ncbi:MAG: hypothetical protein RBS55_06075 [Bacteroidales bacterium]|jgi:hypothetical protein|nr:hypothetical protein [Bacteroidales bacterium]
MGKVTFQSQQVTLPVISGEVYLFFYDLNNLRKLMPEQIINWQSDTDKCSFDIKGMAHLDLQRGETEPDHVVKIISAGDNPIGLEIRGISEDAGENRTVARIEITAELSPMLQMMVSSPLQNLVKMMAERLEAEMRGS